MSIPGRAPARQHDPFKGTKAATPPLESDLKLAVSTEPLPPTAKRLEDVINDAKAGAVVTADELRSRIVRLFEESRATLAAFYQYSQSAAALAEEYHAARFKEKFPASVSKELTLACTMDARETPASLDKKLSELNGVVIKQIIFDRARTTYYLFV